MNVLNFYCNFAKNNMVLVAQLVRASDCGSEGRGFKSHHAPENKKAFLMGGFFLLFFENFLANIIIEFGGK